MKKQKTLFSCSDCGAKSSKWHGQCHQCGSWNTLIESPVIDKVKYISKTESTGFLNLRTVIENNQSRVSTGSEELDRVLGGGLVRGVVALVGGDPGIGKSTLLLQASASISKKNNVAYISGEESAEQIAIRARRLKVADTQIKVLAETYLERIFETINKEKIDVLIIDSIQTIYSGDLTSAPGSVGQVRECAAQLTQYAKSRGVSVLLVGHVTKEGAIAGPRVLEHMVDVVLYFEGDTHSSFRLIRATKNRFGASNEVGVFAMTDLGLRSVVNPSAIFLSEYNDDVPGSCIFVAQEGTRPLLLEVQALVASSNGSSPRRLSVGLEQNRLAMLLAVLYRHCGLQISDQDVFINAVGGVKVNEPGADLPVLLAIVSSVKGSKLPKSMVSFGEVGLSGEIRPVQNGQGRLKEAAKLGFKSALIPKGNLPQRKIQGMEVLSFDRVDSALSYLES